MVADSVYLKFDLADIRLEDGEPIEAVKISLKIPDPTSDSDSLFMMLSNRLEKTGYRFCGGGDLFENRTNRPE